MTEFFPHVFKLRHILHYIQPLFDQQQANCIDYFIETEKYLGRFITNIFKLECGKIIVALLHALQWGVCNELHFLGYQIKWLLVNNGVHVELD